MNRAQAQNPSGHETGCKFVTCEYSLVNSQASESTMALHKYFLPSLPKKVPSLTDKEVLEVNAQAPRGSTRPQTYGVSD